MRRLLIVIISIISILLFFARCTQKSDAEKKEFLAKNSSFIKSVEDDFNNVNYSNLVAKVDTENCIVYVNKKVWDKELNEIGKSSLTSKWARYFQFVKYFNEGTREFYMCWVQDNKTKEVLADYNHGNVILK